MDTTDETVALSDEATTKEVEQEYGGLSAYIKAKFVRAKNMSIKFFKCYQLIVCLTFLKQR